MDKKTMEPTDAWEELPTHQISGTSQEQLPRSSSPPEHSSFGQHQIPTDAHSTPKRPTRTTQAYSVVSNESAQQILNKTVAQQELPNLDVLYRIAHEDEAQRASSPPSDTRKNLHTPVFRDGVTVPPSLPLSAQDDASTYRLKNTEQSNEPSMELDGSDFDATGQAQIADHPAEPEEITLPRPVISAVQAEQIADRVAMEPNPSSDTQNLRHDFSPIIKHPSSGAFTLIGVIAFLIVLLLFYLRGHN